MKLFDCSLGKEYKHNLLSFVNKGKCSINSVLFVY